LHLADITDEVTLKGISWAEYVVRMGKKYIPKLEGKLDKNKPLV